MHRTGFRILWITLVICLVAATINWRTTVSAQPARAESPAFAEPVVLSTQDGVLEVVLSAEQGEGKLDTVKAPVKNMLLFSYKVVKGKASNGQASGKDLYPAPTLNVKPGETLIVHLENKLVGLSVADFFDPAYTPKGEEVAITPPPLMNAPFNLHTHGLHVSPMGNSDNVLLMLPTGAKNTYSFKIPKDHAEGMYWYHGHLHTLTTAQTYMGLAGMLIIGRADGNIPLVTENDVPIRNMALQYNFVGNRQGGQNQLNNPQWPQFVSTHKAPEPGELENGTYQPSLAPVNFKDAAAGSHYVTNWYSGPLSIDNHRGQFELIPNNLIAFKGANPGSDLPANPGLDDAKRDVQFTVNGQFQPRLSSLPGQTEIWNLANISDLAYIRVQLTETATGNHPPLVIVAQDGLPYPQAQAAREGNGTVLSIPPASRYAIAVTIPKDGDLILEMPTATDLHDKYDNQGIAYTSRGGKAPTAVLGRVSVDPKFISYFDGFFIFPTQVLLRAGAAPDAKAGKTVAFQPGQKLGARSAFFQTEGSKPDVKRSMVINGGFLDEKATLQEPKAFIYAFDGKAFPNTPLLRARVGSLEEWSFVNYNNDEHPIHIHVNDFQVTNLVDPVEKTKYTYQPWGQDNVNVPAPLMGPAEKVIAPGELTLRTRFQDFLGSYVIHCHRLNHEDNGLMAMVNVIPAVSSYAVVHNGTVEIRDGKGDAKLASVTPFPGYKGTLSVALSDIDADTVLDLIVGTGPGVPAQVVAYSGAGEKPYGAELARFAPFEKEFSGGVSVAAGNLDGNAGADNIVVATGPGVDTRVVVFSHRLPAPGKAPEIVGDFSPYPGKKGGVVLGVGMIDTVSGLNSIITAPGPGEPATIRAFRYELENSEFCSPDSGPAKIAEFLAFDKAYTGGVTLACDWTAGSEGGAQMILVAQNATPGEVRAYSSGLALDGFPAMYTTSPTHHDGPLSFRPVAKFVPFEGAQGVSVATTSTTSGANLLVSGKSAEGRGEVRKYELHRAKPAAKALSAKMVGKVESVAGVPATLGGD